MNFFIFLTLISSTYLGFWFFYTFSFADWWFIPTLLTLLSFELFVLSLWEDQ